MFIAEITKSRPLDPVVNRLNQVHTLTTYSSNIPFKYYPVIFAYVSQLISFLQMKEYNLWNSSLRNYFHPPVTSSPFERLWGHPASYPMGTRGSFPGGKAAGT
jgi:hypothetical protein